MDFDAARLQPAGPIEVVFNDFAWKEIRLPYAKAKVIPGDEQLKVLAEGEALGSDITLGRRYVGRAPDSSFTAEFNASVVGGNLKIFGDATLAAAQQPVELDLSFQGMAADVDQYAVCAENACEISNVIYKYNLNVAGETFSGVSRCQEPTCSLGGRAHDLSTKDTNKFFANFQKLNLINPLVLGGAYAQMLQGVAVGNGHKVNF
jgi:hypothetical protein